MAQDLEYNPCEGALSPLPMSPLWFLWSLLASSRTVLWSLVGSLFLQEFGVYDDEIIRMFLILGSSACVLEVPFGDPHNKDFSIVGSILGFPYHAYTDSSLCICIGRIDLRRGPPKQGLGVPLRAIVNVRGLPWDH